MDYLRYKDRMIACFNGLDDRTLHIGQASAENRRARGSTLPLQAYESIRYALREPDRQVALILPENVHAVPGACAEMSQNRAPIVDADEY